MANLKEIRTRIASVKKTRKVTSAMQMVSAAKLRKAQNLFNQFLPYFSKQKEILEKISQKPEEVFKNDSHTEAKKGAVLLVVVSANKGLCGPFNINIIKEIQRLATEKYAQEHQQKRLKLLCIGKKAHQLLQRSFPIVDFSEDLSEDAKYDEISELASKILQEFQKGIYKKVELVYNHAKSTGSQVVATENYLPLEATNLTKATCATDYVFESSQEDVILNLIPLFLKTKLYKALVDSQVAEHAARMIAMNKATDNAGALIRSLNLEYNKARQAAITNEILEIVSGATALR